MADPRHIVRGALLFRRNSSRLPQALVARSHRVAHAISHSVGVGSHSGSRTALFGKPNGWVTFCDTFSLPPFPANHEHLLLWLEGAIEPPNPVSVGTAERYLKGVKGAHRDRLLPWFPKGSDELRDIGNFFTGKLKISPPNPPAAKHTICPLTLIRFALSASSSGVADSHEQRTFDAVSSALSLRGRRGGEFWPRTNASLRLIRWKHFSTSINPPGFHLLILTKTSTTRMRIFFPALPGCVICPLARFARMRDLSPFPTGPEDPIMVVAGRPLRRSFMMSRTRAALTLSGIPLTGKLGSKVWRAGLATLSVKAGMNEATTKQLGLWKSSAYKAYLALGDDNITKAVSSLVGLPSSAPASLPSSGSSTSGAPVFPSSSPATPSPAVLPSIPPFPARPALPTLDAASESSDSDWSSSDEEVSPPLVSRPSSSSRPPPRPATSSRHDRILAAAPTRGSRESARIRSPSFRPVTRVFYDAEAIRVNRY